MAKMRSPNYPALGLSESLQRVKSLWMKEKRTAVPADVAAKAIGYSSLSGPSRTAIAAMKKFGLVDSDDRTVRVSDLALRILHPENEDAALKAMQEAALNPELFAQLYQTHVHASDDAIRSYLITKLDFSEGGARQVIKAFRDTLSTVKLDKPEYITQRNRSVIESYQDTDNMAVDVDQRVSMASDIKDLGSLSSHHQTSQTFSWPLSPDVSAEVRITGSELRPEYFEALRQYLGLAEKLVKPAFQEGDTVEYVDAYTGETKFGRIERMYGSDAIIRTITKEEAGPNPKQFAPRPDPARVAKQSN